MLAQKISLVPEDYKKKDPRNLLYFYPSMNKITLTKKILKFSFYQTLEVIEKMAKMQGFILLPWECINWQRAKKYSSDRKIKVGRNTYFMLRPDELTKSESIKLEQYLEDLKIQ